MCEFIGDFVTDFIESKFTDVLENMNYDELYDEISPLISHSSNLMYV